MLKRVANLTLHLSISILVCISSQYICAGQGQTLLKSTINLVPSCLINSTSYGQGQNNLDLGELNFGQQSIYFNTANATLANQHNAIRINCPLNTLVSLNLNGGVNSSHTLSQNASDRAMSNGSGKYIAYKIYKDNQNGQLLTPQVNISLNGGVTHEIKLYAEAYNNNSVVVGQYTDQVTITITF